MADKKNSFENSIKELEKIVEQLEKGECGLEESISLYEKGMKLSAECAEQLENARRKIITLTDAEESGIND